MCVLCKVENDEPIYNRTQWPTKFPCCRSFCILFIPTLTNALFVIASCGTLLMPLFVGALTYFLIAWMMCCKGSKPKESEGKYVPDFLNIIFQELIFLPADSPKGKNRKKKKKSGRANRRLS